MKKDFNKKLSLRKETISNLNGGEMNAIVGGDTLITCRTCNDTCVSRPYVCPTANYSQCYGTCNATQCGGTCNISVCGVTCSPKCWEPE